ncbi:TIGR02594 family protein [Mesorhizobium sp. CAU 1741]|uniref:TIGR02594 family protein n=1 Tax=Mesorhizobium sp. CAU 1741 TaxID=3140366 RepID=UPI00325BD906
MARENVVRTVTIKGREEGLDQVATKLRKVGQDAHQGGQRIGDLDRQLDSLDKTLAGAPRAFAAFEKGAATLERGLNAGKISAQDFSRQMVELQQRLQKTISPRIAVDVDQSGLRSLIDGQTELDGATRRSIMSMIKQQEELQRHATRATAAIDAETAALRMQTAAANDNAASFRRRNLGYQLFDIGQTAALGMSPAMIAMQQGPQIAQMYAGEGGVNQALKDTGNILGGIARRFGPIGIAAGAAGLAIAGIQSEINATSDVMVSFGDVAWAVPQLIGEAIYEFAQPAIAALAPWFAEAWTLIKESTRDVGNFIVREFAAQYEILKTTVQSIVPAFLVAGEAAANGFITAMNWMTEKAVAGVNTIIGAMNDMIEFMGGDTIAEKLGFNLDIGTIEAPVIAPLDLGGQQALEDLNERWSTLRDTLGEIDEADFMGRLFGAIQQQAIENATERLAENEEALKATKSTTRDLADHTKKAGAEMAEAFNPVRDLFEGILDILYSSGDAMEKLISIGANIGKQFASKGLDTILQALGIEGAGNVPAPARSFAGAPSVAQAKQLQAVNDNLKGVSTSAIDVAKQFAGLNERADSAVLDSFLQASGTWSGMSSQDFAWCASFANAAIVKAGGQGTGSNMASSFLGWGQGTNAPQIGDIVVLRPQARGTSGHVGFVAGFGDGTVQVFGGNQGQPGGANTKSFGLDQVAGFRFDPSIMRDAVSGGMTDFSRSAQYRPEMAGNGPGGFKATNLENMLGIGGAAFGAFAGGMQSGDPLSGGLSGALAGLGAAPQLAGALNIGMGAAGALGLAGGAIVGACAGKMGKREEDRRAA